MTSTHRTVPNSSEASLLRQALRHCDADHPGKPFKIFAQSLRVVFERLAALGLGDFVANGQGGATTFTPNAAARDWVKAQPLHSLELRLLRYFSPIGIELPWDERDPGYPYPEHRTAAHVLALRGFGTYHPGVVPEVDPYFVISAAGLAVITARFAA